MLRLIQSFLGTVVAVSLLVTNAAAFHDSLAGSSAAKRRMTNGERLARGLPLNPPAVRYTPGVLRARDGASATTTSSSSSTTSSSSSTTPTPTPPVTCPMTGYIEYGNNGYVSAADGLFFGLVSDTSDAALVTFDACATGLVGIQCSNCSPAYIGIVAASESITPANKGSVSLIPMPKMPPGPPTPNGAAFFESTIWLYDKTTSGLILNWENEDYSNVTLSVTYDSSEKGFEVSYSATPTAYFYFVPQL